MSSKKFSWKEEYSVGVDWIDEQHKHFIDIANEIIETTEKNVLTRDDLLMCMGHLADHAFYHFDEEEKYLKTSNYPDSKEHLAAHVKYRVEIKEMIEYVRSQDADVKIIALKVVSFAEDWLSRHMLGVEKEKAHYLKNKGA